MSRKKMVSYRLDPKCIARLAELAQELRMPKTWVLEDLITHAKVVSPPTLTKAEIKKESK